MKLSQMLIKTYREAPSDGEVKSHKLLVRAGYIKKVSAGSYMYLPLAFRVLEKIKKIIREELDSIGCEELMMPLLLPQEMYAGRLDKFGNEMFRLTDRNNRDMCLGPTHEEAFVDVVKDKITSYKQLPINLYQISTKFRDEVRPRFGLQRAKEFIMKDAYSFHADAHSLDLVYNDMKNAYFNIFNRIGLTVVPVDADTGAMGGSGSQEFMVINDVGEDEIVFCPNCRYSANGEKAISKFVNVKNTTKLLTKNCIDTPNVKTIQDLLQYLNNTLKTKYCESDMLKCIVYKSEKGVVAVFVRGDREVEETKIKNYLNLNEIEMADANDILNINSVAGYTGPFDLKTNLVVVDNEAQNMVNFVCGSNKKDKHITNFNLSDINLKCIVDGKEKSLFADIRKVVKGDLCSVCGKPLDVCRGIEIGHIFKLGQKYTKPLECKYLDVNGKSQYMEMGCYGIGISRTLSSVVEQYSDEQGIIWPEIIAPYKVQIVVANSKDEKQVEKGELLYNKLKSNKVEVLLDDRKDNIGVKLNDAELMGMPYIVVVGRDCDKNLCELIERKTLNKSIKTFDEILKFLK